MATGIPLTAEQQLQITSLIHEGYNTYNLTESSASKYHILYSIVDMKCSIGDYKIYRDLKRCIKHHIESADEQDFGYDLVSINEIVESSKVLPLYEQQALLKSFTRILEEHGYEDEKEQVSVLLKKLKLVVMNENKFSFINPFYYASAIALRSPIFIGAIILILLLTESIFLLPAHYKSCELFKFTPHPYTASNYLNTLISIPIMLLSIDDDIKVKPITITGVIIIIAAKTFFATVVLGFLVKKIEEKSKL